MNLQRYFSQVLKLFFLVNFKTDLIKCIDTLSILNYGSFKTLLEPSSLGTDADIPMDIDSNDMNSDGSRGLDDSEEPSPPEDKMFFLDPTDVDVERDEETVKTIR